MITLCWAAKGGSGTTVVATVTAIENPRPTLLLDLGGDVPIVAGLTEPDGAGLSDWLRSEATGDQLTRLELPLDADTMVVPRGSTDVRRVPADRWRALADRLTIDGRDIVVDAGTGVPPAALVAVAERRWLVMRACYLALTAATRHTTRPTGVVLVREPGRSLRRRDIEAAIGAPVVVEVLADPAVARAVDSGLIRARLPAPFRDRLTAA